MCIHGLPNDSCSYILAPQVLHKWSDSKMVLCDCRREEPGHNYTSAFKCALPTRRQRQAAFHLSCMIWIAKRVPKGRHFGSANGAKVDTKTESTFKSEKIHLGKGLGRFGAVWGVARGRFLLIFHWFSFNFVQIIVFAVEGRPGAIRYRKR